MKSIKVITTQIEKGQYWQEQTLPASPMTDAMHRINVHAELENQTIQGFGGAFTEASAYNYAHLSKEDQEAFMKAYFSQEGLGYNMGRLTMNSCDFALGNYDYVTPYDDTLESFTVEHDYAQIIPMIQKAQQTACSPLTFLVSPWSPPAFMKTTGMMNQGGKLKTEYYEAWARYFVKFIEAYQEADIKIDALTVQNEPMAVQTWDSCIYTGAEEGTFIGSYLGPCLEATGHQDVKIYAWDHNKEALLERAHEVMQQAQAAQYVKGFAVHWYTGDHFEAITHTKRSYPEQEIIFTEGCVEYSRFSAYKEQEQAEMYAHDLIGNLKAGISAFLDWNLLLDAKGGPNHVGNFCAAPIMCTEEGRLKKHASYYYIGHFSKYVKAGAKVIATSQYTDKIEVVGFVNPDGERVITALNRSEEPIEITLYESGEGICHKLGGRSLTTFVYSL